MFHNMARLRGTRIGATDGEIGELMGLFFDEKTWQIRCLVLDTGHWLGGRKVLIAVDYFQRPKGRGEKLHVNVTRDQIENSPALLKAESARGQIGKLSVFDYHILEPSREFSLVGPEPGIIGKLDTRLLHGTDEVAGYTIHTTDGDIGHLVDFIFDDESWIVRYLVVDTGSWWPGRKVLLSPEWVESMNWYDNKVFVNVSRESIKTAPSCEPLELPNRECEEKVFAHYERPGYWIPSSVPGEPGFEGFGETGPR